MIVPMKKIFLIMQKNDSFAALDELRKEGILHVEHDTAPMGTSLKNLKDDISLLKKVLHVLPEHHLYQKPLSLEEWKEKAREILSLCELLHALQDSITKRNILIDFWKPWGDFDVHQIASLKDNGIYVALYKIPTTKLEEIRRKFVVREVFAQSHVAHCVVIGREEIQLPFTGIPLPSMSLNQMKAKNIEEKGQKKEIEDELRAWEQYTKAFRKILVKLEEDLRFHEVYEGMGGQEDLVYVKGFCPEDLCEDIERKAKEQEWGILIEQPQADDKVPTLLRNPRWVQFIQPVFKLINVLPGYKEFDVSLLFLVFFSLFFGILIGDAGYGLIFALLTAVAQKKMSDKIKDATVFHLMYILSGCTIVWGLFTGTFFGQAWLPSPIKPLVPWLADIQNVQMLCFLIGAIHLSLAHAWRGLMKWPSLACVSEIGWITMLWGMFYAARLLILNESFPPFAKIFFIVGPLLIIFFSKPQKNILKALGGGLGDFVGNAVNTFTDVVSYIRLFAVGLATVAVADAFNQMAMGIGFPNILVGFFTAVILVVGHFFNMVLGGMAILVHGLRLNLLEFSSHLNMEWTGLKYEPFKKTEEQANI